MFVSLSLTVLMPRKEADALNPMLKPAAVFDNLTINII